MTHPSLPSAVLHLTNEEWRLNQVPLGKSWGHVSSVHETDWSRWITTVPLHTNNEAVRIVAPSPPRSTRGRLF